MILSSLSEDPVERLLAADPTLVRLAHEITGHQRLLKEACSEEAWRTYLRIEGLMNERMFSFADKWTKKSPAPLTGSEVWVFCYGYAEDGTKLLLAGRAMSGIGHK